MSTQQDQVVVLANRITNLASQFWSLGVQVDDVLAAYTNLSAGTKLALFPTAPQNATGGLGTADGSPDVTHPIDTRVAPGSGVSIAISPNNLAGLVTVLTGFKAAISGSAVSANGATVQLLALTH